MCIETFLKLNNDFKLTHFAFDVDQKFEAIPETISDGSPQIQSTDVIIDKARLLSPYCMLMILVLKNEDPKLTVRTEKTRLLRGLLYETLKWETENYNVKFTLNTRL